MGLYDRPYYREENSPGLQLRAPRSAVTAIILINVAVFVLDMLAAANLNDLLGTRSEVLVHPLQWWRLLTYGFAHDDGSIMHLLCNMMGLFFFGRDIESVYGRRSFTVMYLVSIVLCGLVWTVKEYALSGPQIYPVLFGASGAVTTVLMLFALNFPKRTVLFMLFIPMPAWVFGILLILFNLMSFTPVGGAPGENIQVAFDVHLVGAAFGFLCFATRFDFGRLWPGNLSSLRRRIRPGPKLRVHKPDNPYREMDTEADRVLDKLHRLGEASLTGPERKVLEDYSRRMQQKHR